MHLKWSKTLKHITCSKNITQLSHTRYNHIAQALNARSLQDPFVSPCKVLAHPYLYPLTWQHTDTLGPSENITWSEGLGV